MRFVSWEASFSPKVSSEVRDPKPMPAPPPQRQAVLHVASENGAGAADSETFPHRFALE